MRPVVPPLAPTVMTCLAAAAWLAAGCAREPTTLPPETFTWAPQPISFSPPPTTWRREGENGGGMLGVRFVRTGGVGECILVVTYKLLADRDRSRAIATLLSRRDSMYRREFLHELSLARPHLDDFISEREQEAALATNAALDRAMEDYLADRPTFVAGDLEAALRAASAYRPTLAEVLPRIRLRPERMQEPDRWRLGYERDTTIAGHPAFAGDDTLFVPERTLLYREIFWVVNGCAFKASYQGTKANEPDFDRLVGTIRFPEGPDVASR